MKKNRIAANYSRLAAVSLSLLPIAGYTADLGFEPRISTGVMRYSFENSGAAALLAGADGRINYDDELVFIGGGGTAFFKHLFADIYFQQSTKGEVFEDETPQTFAFGLKPERQDFSGSLGFSILPNFAVFAGYKYGKTENDGEVFGNADFQGGRSFNQKFEEDGPFVGAVYGWNLGDTGTLSVNLAVAFLDADVEDRIQLLTPQSSFDERKLSGDAIGVSYGVSWHAPITDHLSYAVKLNGYTYNFDNFKGTSLDGIPGVSGASSSKDVKIDENMIGINVELSYSL